MPLRGTELARAEVTIGGNDTDLQNTLARASRSMEKTGRKMQRVGKRMSATITAPLVAAGAAAVKFAADAEETRNLFNVAMGDMAGEARTFAEARAEALSLDPVSFQKTMAIFQQMFSSMGLAEEEALRMSKALSQLQVDMSSFFNLPMEEALQKLQSGIAGEIEPLRRLGVNVSQAKIEMVALREGIIETGEAMTEQEKIQARFIAIMEQLENAHGDFERTSGSLTNTLRQLREQGRVVAREFGEFLIPVAQDLANITKDMIGFFKSLPAPMQGAIVKAAALSAAFGPLLFVGGKLLTMIRSLTSALVALRGVQIGSAVARWTAAFGRWAIAAGSLRNAIRLLKLAVAGPAGLVAGLVLVAGGLGVKAAMDRMSEAADKLKEKTSKATEAIAGLVEKSRGLAREQRAQVLSSLGAQITAVEQQLAEAERRMAVVSQPMGDPFEARKAADNVEFLTSKLERLRQAMREVREQGQRTFDFGPFRGGGTSTDTGGGDGGGDDTAGMGGFSPIGFGRSLEEILRPKFVQLGIVTAEAFGQHIMRETTEALRRAGRQARQLGLGPDRMRELVTPPSMDAGFIDDAKKKLEQQTEELRKQKQVWNDIKRAVGQELSNALVDLFTNLEDIGASLKSLFTSILDTIHRIIVRLAVNQILNAAFSGGGGGGGGSFAGMFAAGGTIPAGSFGVVGEQGPELVSGPATVTPMGRGGTSGEVNVHQTVNFNISAVDGRSVKQMLKQHRGTIQGIVGEAAKRSTGFRRNVIAGK